MAIELHLPDLPDVPISLGPAPAAKARAPLPWHVRARLALSAYAPLVLMLLLALGTWWLVRNTPALQEAGTPAPARSEPDYTMQGFEVERFDATGRLKIRIQGTRLRHYPDTDRIEVDEARIRAMADDGRATVAQADRAVSNGDGSEVQLFGNARVDGSGPRGEPIEFRGDFLHAFLHTEKLRSHLPVWVRRDNSEFRADGLEYDNLSGLLQLKGQMRALLMPASAASSPSAASSAAAR
ncbi:MAG: LPS export ABC transporter periplasmic protein LptC [Rubrivivax sp.]